jgi:hypothetical protein
MSAQSRTQNSSEDVTKITYTLNATRQALKSALKGKLQEEQRADRAEALYRAQESLVSSSMDEKADLQQDLSGAGLAEEDAKRDLRAVNADFKQSRAQATQITEQAQQQAIFEGEQIRVLQSKLQECQRNRSRVQAVAEDLSRRLQETQQDLQKHVSDASNKVASVAEGLYAESVAMMEKEAIDKLQRAAVREEGLIARLEEKEQELKQR